MKVTDKQKKAIDKFIGDYEAFCNETGDRFQLAEDATTYYALNNVRVMKTCVKFTTEYSGVSATSYNEVINDEQDLKEQLAYWKACLRRAKRYWGTSSEVLDAMADGTVEDDTEQDE